MICGFIYRIGDKAVKSATAQIKYRKTVKKPFSAAELDRIRKACGNIRDLAIVDFLYSTGCRVSEAVRMDVEDADFERMECRVLGKGDKERIVYLSPVAAMHLKEYLGSREDAEDCLFEGWRGKRITKNGIEALIRRIGAYAGVDNAHPHRFL